MVVGKSVARVDAYDKVTGRAKFTDDLVMPGCLVARVYHARIGHGRVVSIDTSEAEAMEGVVKVVTFKDVPKVPYPTPGHPWSVEAAHQDVCDRLLLTEHVRYYGDDIAAVVAEDEETLKRAKELVEVDYEPLEPVRDVHEAMAPGAPAPASVPPRRKDGPKPAPAAGETGAP